jgi:hypothetical protein
LLRGKRLRRFDEQVDVAASSIVVDTRAEQVYA